MIAALRPVLLLGSAMVMAAAPDEGWQAYTAGEFTRAVAAWTQEASGGDAEAAFGLGIAYDLGNGANQDEARACLWYRRAGEAGIVAGLFNTAVMMDQGECGTRDPAVVAAWYGRAAATGHARAEYDLAQLYQNGDGVPRNTDQAVVWYRLAAAGGIPAATSQADVLSRSRRVPGATLQPVQPATPVDETLPDHGQPVPFVWSAPPQPGPVRFFLQLDLLGADGAQEVAARYVDQSATAVTLQPGTAQYAWRVYSVLLDGHRYVASDWSRFRIAGRTAR